jgi:hypothetical protein
MKNSQKFTESEIKFNSRKVDFLKIPQKKICDFMKKEFLNENKFF